MTLDEYLADLAAKAEKATPGPWAIESCGEKGDGTNMIGVTFGPKDMNAEHPLSGWLEPFDDDGNEIDYYRDELVACCEHRDRNSGQNAAHIAAFSPDVAAALVAVAEAAHRLNTVKEGFQLTVAGGDLSQALDRLTALARVR